jgi:hypothetical protein
MDLLLDHAWLLLLSQPPSLEWLLIDQWLSRFTVSCIPGLALTQRAPCINGSTVTMDAMWASNMLVIIRYKPPIQKY